jgi:uncharacterized caspase-like protein/uncharacterized protein
MFRTASYVVRFAFTRARLAHTLLFSTLLIALTAAPALAERRVALVIGNAAYAHAPTLANPVNDASDMAAALKELGFEVLLGTDLDKHALDDRIHAFANALDGADVGLFFYAGHGLQANGRNYLVPTDAQLAAERDLDFQAVQLGFVLTQMEREAKTNIVILDACRNNPLARNLARSMGTRAVGESGGLAPVATGFGTFIAYATQPGNVALDGSGRNSPFTGALKKYVGAPGLSLPDIMIEVRNEVATLSHGDQIPWDHSALRGRFYFKPAAPQRPAAAPAPGSASQYAPLSDAAQTWAATKDTTSRAVLEAFIGKFKGSTFALLAEARLAEIERQAVPTAPNRAPQAAVTAVAPPPQEAAAAIAAVQPSFDCTGNLSAAEAAVCGSTVLSLLDDELTRAYGRIYARLTRAEKQTLLAEQRKWLTTRNACDADTNCLMAEYRARVQQLHDWSAGGTAAATATTTTGAVGTVASRSAVRPSFDCGTAGTEAEKAVCGDAELAQLDVQLNAAYGRVADRLNAAAKKTLLAEQKVWLDARNACAGDVSCLKAQYASRVRRLEAWR